MVDRQRISGLKDQRMKDKTKAKADGMVDRQRIGELEDWRIKGLEDER